eukprot:TRINITY_DN2970_c0_g2_i4.p1 TRINITY_DN2970_c0_g2~~TRINITY_DN2970_c0_g2_i4.p1  ORF type:complete len:424 (+),score=37.30 TRINITY_DN2970_c0_g2_i4:66-1337(+)
MCIRDRRRVHGEIMQKVSEFKKYSEIATSKEVIGLRRVQGSRKFKVRRDDNPNFMFFHDILGPIVANVRGQCGIIQPLKAMCFKEVGRHKRRSHRKYLIEANFIENELGDRQENFLDQPIFVNTAEKFWRLTEDLSTMLRKRGLAMQNVTLPSLNKGQDSCFWLSETSLQSIFDTAKEARIIFEDVEDEENELGDMNLQLLVQKHIRGDKWLLNTLKVLEEYPILNYPPKMLKTRQSWVNLNSLRQSIIQSTDEDYSNLMYRLIHNCGASTFQNALASFSLTKSRALPAEWPIKEVISNTRDLRDNLVTFKAKLDELKGSTFRVKVDILWETYPLEINSKCTKLAELLAQVPSLSFFKLNLVRTKLNDQGFAEIVKLLECPNAIVWLVLSLFETNLTDKGVINLASIIPSLPLQQFVLDLGKY